jgi:hypothetical protein
MWHGRGAHHAHTGPARNRTAAATSNKERLLLPALENKRACAMG